MIFETAVTLTVAAVASALLPGLERKIQARIQNRYGPPITTPGLWNALKSYYKQSKTPDSPNPGLYHLTLLVGVGCTLAILLITTPAWQDILGFATILGIAGLLKIEEATYLFMGSLSRSMMSKTMPFPDTITGAKKAGVRVFFEDIGTLRALKMITFGSFPYYAALLVPFAAASSLNIKDVLAQAPAIYTVSGAIACFVYFMGYNIVINNRPFDIIKPKVDIIEGPYMEYIAGWRGLTYLMKGLITFVLSSVFVTLFLGVALDISNPTTFATHLILTLILPAFAAILRAFSPVLTFKQIYPISYTLTLMGLLALILNILGA